MADTAWLACPQFGDMHGFGGLWHAGLAELRRKVGVTPRGDGEGTANTALVYHAKKLLALHEGDLPYAVRAFAAAEPACQTWCMRAIRPTRFVSFAAVDPAR